jgi:excisionase family DNA binding protein
MRTGEEPVDAQRLMTVSETMAALGIAHPNTIYSMLRRKELRGFKIRKVYRIETASVQEYLDRVAGLGGAEEYLTVDEVAEDLRVVRVTVYRMIRDDGLPAVKIRKEWRIPKDRYEEWRQELMVA